MLERHLHRWGWIVVICGAIPSATSAAQAVTEPKLVALGFVALLLLLVRRRSGELRSSRWDGGRYGPHLQATGAAGLVLLVVGLVSAVASPAPLRSLAGVAIHGDGVLYWLLSFVVIVLLVRDRSRARLRTRDAHWIVTTSLLILCGLTLAQAFVLPVLHPLGVFGLYPERFQQLLSPGQLPMATTSSRGYLGFSAGLLWIAHLALRFRGRETSLPREGALAYVTCTVLVLSQTRGVWLAVVLAFLALAITGAFGWGLPSSSEGRRIVRRTLGLVVVGFGLAGATYGVALPAGAVRTARELPSFDEGMNATSSGRLWIWRTGLKAAVERPLFGWGVGNFGLALTMTANDLHWDEVSAVGDNFVWLNDGGDPPYHKIVTNRAHNLWIEGIVTTGAVGFVARLALLAIVAVVAWRSANPFVIAGFVFYVVYLQTWYTNAQTFGAVVLVLAWLLRAGFDAPSPGSATKPHEVS